MIAIHVTENSFSDRWILYCRDKGIDFIEVDIFDNNIVGHLQQAGTKYLLVHLDLLDHRTELISNSILLAIEKAGIHVFPDLNTYWHHDDKVAQKYMFEAQHIPHPNTWVFYNKDEAKRWLTTASFPLVFKLRGGSASANVVLLKDMLHAKRYVHKMFGKGIKPIPSIFNDYRNRVKVHSRKRDWGNTLRRLPRTIFTIMLVNSRMSREKGYFLVQEFIPGNPFDTRIVVIGDRAFAIRRIARHNDFRSSGSGDFDLSNENINREALALAFDTAKKLKIQSMACDVVFDRDKRPLILEVCYAFVSSIIYETGGYWDSSLKFYNQPTWPEDLIIEHVLGILKNEG